MRPLYVILLVFCVANIAAAEPLMDCNDKIVEYSEPHVIPLEKHVSVKPLPKSPHILQVERDPEFHPQSPQRTAAFNRVGIADTMKPGPYSSAVEVFSISGDPFAWRLDYFGVIDNIRLKWLNEELLFVQAWWGTIMSTDMIFNVRSGQFIYAKEANYGSIVQPCEEHNHSVMGDIPQTGRPLCRTLGISMKNIEDLNVTLLFFLCAMVVIWFVLVLLLFKRLKSEHPDEYDAIGSPSFLERNKPGNAVAMLKFLITRKHKYLNDSYLSKLSDIMLVFFFVDTILFFMLFFDVFGQIAKHAP